MIQVAVREENGGDRRMTRPTRMQAREALDLGTDLWGAVQHDVGRRAFGADGHGLLRAGGRAQRTVAHSAAVRAAAVPLREPAPGGGA